MPGRERQSKIMEIVKGAGDGNGNFGLGCKVERARQHKVEMQGDCRGYKGETISKVSAHTSTQPMTMSDMPTRLMEKCGVVHIKKTRGRFVWVTMRVEKTLNAEGAQKMT